MKAPKLDIAASYTIAAIGGGLALTGWLGKSGRRQITQHIKDNKSIYALLVLYFAGHVENVLGPFDVFNQLGKIVGITPRDIVTEVTEEALDGMLLGG